MVAARLVFRLFLVAFLLVLGAYLAEGFELGRVIVLLPVSRQRLAVDLFPPVDLLIVKFAEGPSGFGGWGFRDFAHRYVYSSWLSLKPMSSPRRRLPPLAVTSCVAQPSLAVDLFSLEKFLLSNL